MPKTILSFVFVVLLMSSACNKDLSKGGVRGTLKYGEGSCQFDHSQRHYDYYNGYVFIVSQHVRDTFSGNFHTLLNYSDSTMARNGKFSQALSPGQYYVCIREHISFTNNNMFYVNEGQVSEDSFLLYKCI